MTLIQYLDRVDARIMYLINSGVITRSEGITIQEQAYAFENFTYGMEWLNKKTDNLTMD